LKRRPLLAGNWKMNLDRKSAVELVRALKDAKARDGAAAERDIAVFPPFVYLDEVARAAAGSGIVVGAQDVCDERDGAFTGEVSAEMLLDVGATHVLVGHSERRHLYGESDELCNRKVLRALSAGLKVVLCVGEKLEERDGNRTEEVIARQTTRGLQEVAPDAMGSVTLAYEPVWAIGTGRNATPAQAGAAHSYLRGILRGLYDERIAQATRILYGGSVKADNASALMAAPDVDGALVGGASLKAETFLGIVRYK
jgi:triosephosphate isomerase (TIM)